MTDHTVEWLLRCRVRSAVVCESSDSGCLCSWATKDETCEALQRAAGRGGLEHPGTKWNTQVWHSGRPGWRAGGHADVHLPHAGRVISASSAAIGEIQEHSGRGRGAHSRLVGCCLRPSRRPSWGRGRRPRARGGTAGSTPDRCSRTGSSRMGSTPGFARSPLISPCCSSGLLGNAEQDVNVHTGRAGASSRGQVQRSGRGRGEGRGGTGGLYGTHLGSRCCRGRRQGLRRTWH